jgi:hypothetical protein
MDRQEIGAGLIALSGIMGGLDLAQFGIDIPMDLITVIVLAIGLALTVL